MKRKKWSELEEQTLLSKYSDLLNSGTLAKLKTREKKFKPIADHVNYVHHLQDPSTFPFRWSWRDVSIKVQNMRHQYLGVKQKIRVPDGDFNWKDGENHWENFLKYKEVFGDVELEIKNNNNNHGNNKRLFGEESVDLFGSNSGGFGDDVLGLGFEIDSEDLEEDGDLGDDLGGSESEFRGETEELAAGGEGFLGGKRLKKSGDGDWGSSKRLGLVGAQMLELREVMLRREEKRREREWSREESLLERQDYKKILQKKRDGGVGMRELELEDRQIMWARREAERRLRLEREFDEERRRRMKMEERWEEEEMGWKERTLGLQIEHEKQMMQMHAHACQNQMQILGVMARLVCQFFGAGNDGLGSGNDGLGGGLGALPPQDLQSLQHPGGLGDNGKPDANSPSEFI